MDVFAPGQRGGGGASSGVAAVPPLTATAPPAGGEDRNNNSCAAPLGPAAALLSLLKPGKLMAECNDRQKGGGGGRRRRGNRGGEVRALMLLDSFTRVYVVSSSFVKRLTCDICDQSVCKGKYVLFSVFQDRDVRLSKSMSYALRHGANQMGLQIGSGKGSTFIYCL